MRDLMQCQNPSCRQVWPNPQMLPDKQRVVMSKCPKCGTEPKRVGSCESA